jgi:2-phosphosulfolactate phosphatase
MVLELDQRRFAVRMEWGLRGAEAISQGACYAVIVDVLSFSTAVSVALDQGAEVYPYPWRDDSAGAFARKHRAILAVGRPDSRAPVRAPAPGTSSPAESSQAAPVSLSPAAIRAAPGLKRIVLPSPNGSALAAALSSARPGLQILAGCLRNRTALAAWLASQPRAAVSPPVIAVVAAGERWPDDSLRPAAEDLWGSGAVIAALDSLGLTGLSPQARSAAEAWRGIEPTLSAALLSSASGAELARAGFSGDVAMASEVDASASVPLLSGGRFADAVGAQRTGNTGSTAAPAASDGATARTAAAASMHRRLGSG